MQFYFITVKVSMVYVMLLLTSATTNQTLTETKIKQTTIKPANVL